MDVAHCWATFSDHTFPSIFIILFVSHIAIPVKTDIKKLCQQHIQVRYPWKHESSEWKCLLLFIWRFRIGHTTFRWFPQMYFRFRRHHVDISGRDVTELYTAINKFTTPWQCLKSACPYLSQFWRYRSKSGLGLFYTPPAPAAEIRVIAADHSESMALLAARRTNNQPTIGRLRVQGLLK